MKGIAHDVQIFWSILVLVTFTCEGQPQGRPYFQNQQHPQDLQNGVPIQANNDRHVPPNVQQQYRPQPAQGVQQNGQLQGVLLNGQPQSQKNYFFVNSANAGNQVAAAQPANAFQQNGQVYKRVGDFQAPPIYNPLGQNVESYNQPKPQIDTNIGSPIGGARSIGESQRNEIHDNINPGGLVGDNARKVAKESDANKPLRFDSQVANQGTMKQNVLNLQQTETKQNNDSKSVFVINKNRLDNVDNSVKVNVQPKEVADNRNVGIPVNDRIKEIQSRLDRQGPVVSNNEQVQEQAVIDSDVRYPLKGDLERGNIGANQESFDLGNKEHIGANENNANNNLPVDSKLNEAYKDLAQKTKGLPANINVIDGEVEKNKGANEGGMLSDNYDDNDDDDEEDEGAAARRSDTDPETKDNLPNEIPRDINNGQGNQNQYGGFGGQKQGNNWQGNNNVGQQNNFVNGQQFNNGLHLNTGQQPNNGQQFNNVPQINAGQQQNNNAENKEGSLKVVWDWSDFAVNFEQYIAPEQKIRRAPHATTGEPWPLPQYYIAKQDLVYRIDKSVFHFKLPKVKCDIIEKAIERYKSYVLEDSVEEMYDNFQHAQSTLFEDPTLKYETTTYTEAPVQAFLSVKVRKPCGKQLPVEKMDESYDLFIKRTGMFLWANEVWGALRGLETFSQLVFKGPDSELYIKDTVINDYPRFSHRGVLIDSSRHFIFKETIFDALEGMAQNKMNVMHWHIVDDQSFPYQSKAYPDLSQKGAFHPSFVYTPEDIAEVIEFARLRGIRVMPEFDTPGHTYSWGLSRPDLLTQCYQGDRQVDGYLGPLDPSKNETFRFLKNFFKDVLHTFKDQYLHLGGDEVPMTCWSSNPEVLRLLAKLEGRPESYAEGPKNNDPYFYSYDIRKVLEFYVKRLMTDVKQVSQKRPNNVRFVFWQEIMNNDVQLPNDTIIQVWQGGMEEVQRATSLGLNVIYSTCWYLDLIEYGTKWSKYYHCDPVDTMYGYQIDESKVLGGEACLWAEYIDNENLMSTLWPRASAAAERLWSHKDVRDIDQAAARLQEHRCRMLSRGLSVGQISGPDYCLRRGKRHHSVNNTQSVNCTLAQCASFADKGRVEIEKIKVEFQQKGGPISDCSQSVLQAGGNIAVIVLVLIIVAVGFTLKFTKKKIVQVRMCKNKTILLIFITLILVYFMCYTSIWMQALQFKGSFEKRVSSNLDKVS